MAILPAGVLLDDARRRTGLHEFDSEEFLPALEVLWRAMQTEARLTEAGLQWQRAEIVQGLETRLRTHWFFQRFPEIADQPIVAPLLIVGPQRSGTTKLHRLIASDPQWNALYTWQVVNPAPLDNMRPTEDPDPRIALAEAWCKERAFLQAAHSFHPHAVEMEVYFLLHNFVINNPWRLVPTHQKWLETADLKPAYQYLYKQLQFMQWQTHRPPGRRWILKDTSHLFSLPTILQVFPDAKFVMTHRHPSSSLISMMQFTVLTQQNGARSVDRDLIRDQRMRIASLALQRFMEFHDQRPDLFFDIPYRDVVGNTEALVRGIYEFAGAQFTAETRQSIQQWGRDNPQHKAGKFDYDPRDFNLSDEDISREFDRYISRYSEFISM